MGKFIGRSARIAEEKVNAAVAANAPAPGMQTPTPAAAPADVDVEAVLEGMAASSAQKLGWRHSIVDIMKLVGIDNSLSERKALAQELGYTGSMDDRATMNIWLHKEVMRQLAANGGKVPAGMLD